MADSKSYNAWLIDLLRDPDEAGGYIAEHLRRDSQDSDDEHHSLVLLALKNVGAAHGITLAECPPK